MVWQSDCLYCVELGKKGDTGRLERVLDDGFVRTGKRRNRVSRARSLMTLSSSRRAMRSCFPGRLIGAAAGYLAVSGRYYSTPS